MELESQGQEIEIELRRRDANLREIMRRRRERGIWRGCSLKEEEEYERMLETGELPPLEVYQAPRPSA